MKKNAFTLIEVLTVIIILGVISVIFIPNALKILSQNETKIYKSKETMLINAGKDYVLENDNYVLPDIDDPIKYITITTLVNENYMPKILDSKSGAECNGFIKVTNNDVYGYNYEACLLCENYTTNKSFCTTATYNSI